MKRLLAIGALLAVAGAIIAAPPTSPPVPEKPRVPDARDFISQSVLDGLTEDGVSPRLVSDLAKYPDFFPKCPICQPTLQALKQYAMLKETPTPKEGKGLPVELAKRLGSKDNDVRRAALREMIAGYAERGSARVTLTKEERTTLEKELLTMRGGPLKAGGELKFCPSCDGVCRLLPKP